MTTEIGEKRQLVSFYLTLERPLAIRAMRGFINPRDEDVPWLSGITLPKPFSDPAFGTGKNFVAFRPFQAGGEIKFDMKPYTWSEFSAEMVAEGTEVGTSREWPEDVSLGEGVVYTCLEMTTALIFDPDDTEEDALNRALDRCFESLRSYELAYCLISDDLAYPLTTKISAASYCPVNIFDIDEKRVVQRSVMVVNFADAMRHAIPEFLSDQEISDLIDRTNIARSRFPISSSEYWFREARRSQWLLGKTDLAVVQAFTAGEVFLDSVLMMLAWEDITYGHNSSMTKQQVASWYSFKNNHGWRVNKQFRHWLAGWDDGPSPRAHELWLDVAAKVRGRVVHSGYIPTIDEADTVLESYIAVVESIKTLLVDDRNRGRYPRTVLITLSRVGLERFGKYHGRVRRIYEENGNMGFMNRFIEFQQEVLSLVDLPPARGSLY